MNLYLNYRLGNMNKHDMAKQICTIQVNLISKFYADLHYLN